MSPEELLLDLEDRMDKAVGHLTDVFTGIRAGRANPALLENIRVEAYGDKMPLSQLGKIASPEARQLVVEPFDKSLMQAIEKAISSSDLGLNPSNEGGILRINLPILTEERRKEYVKVARSRTEEARVAIRKIRQHGNDDIKKSQKAGDISEDDARKHTDDIQKLTDAHIEKVESMLNAKIKEIETV